MSITTDEDSWIGRALVGRDGRRLGTIEELYRHRHTGRPQWVVVTVGRFRHRRSFVPLNDARRTAHGIETPHDLKTIARSPGADLDEHLRDDQAIALYRHYGLPHDALVEGPAAGDPPTPRDRVLGYLDKSRP
jgi:hypothetical protein